MVLTQLVYSDSVNLTAPVLERPAVSPSHSKPTDSKFTLEYMLTHTLIDSRKVGNILGFYFNEFHNQGLIYLGDLLPNIRYDIDNGNHSIISIDALQEKKSANVKKGNLYSIVQELIALKLDDQVVLSVLNGIKELYNNRSDIEGLIQLYEGTSQTLSSQVGGNNGKEYRQSPIDIDYKGSNPKKRSRDKGARVKLARRLRRRSERQNENSHPWRQNHNDRM